MHNSNKGRGKCAACVVGHIFFFSFFLSFFVLICDSRFSRGDRPQSNRIGPRLLRFPLCCRQVCFHVPNTPTCSRSVMRKGFELESVIVASESLINPPFWSTEKFIYVAMYANIYYVPCMLTFMYDMCLHLCDIYATMYVAFILFYETNTPYVTWRNFFFKYP